jgi:hypothetical protein
MHPTPLKKGTTISRQSHKNQTPELSECLIVQITRQLFFYCLQSDASLSPCQGRKFNIIRNKTFVWRFVVWNVRLG